MKNNSHRTGKYLIIIGFFLLVVNVTLGIILTRQSSNAIRTMIHNRMLDISNTAAAMLDGDALYRASLGEPSVDNEPYEDAWGRFYSAYSPVFNSKHEVAGIVAVDFSADWYDRQISNQIRTTLIITIVSLTFGALLVLMIASRFSKRFKLLYNELNDLSDGIESLADELSTTPSKDKTKDRVHKSKELDEEKAQDDISAISNKIRDLQEDLSRQISIVKGQAYIDGLTGLENRTSYMECLKHLEEQIEKGDMSVAMSKGYAIYDREKDKTYKDTFSRADDAMYADKKAYYMTYEDRRKK